MTDPTARTIRLIKAQALREAAAELEAFRRGSAEKFAWGLSSAEKILMNSANELEES